MNLEKKSLVKQGFWNATGLIINLMSTWLIMMLLPKLVDYEKTGYYSLGFSLAQLFTTISIFSLREYQVITGYNKISEKVFFSFRIYTTIISFFLSLIYSLALRYKGYLLYSILIFLVSNNITNIAEVMIGSFQLNGRLDINGYTGITLSICRFVIFLIIIKLTKNFYNALLFGEIIPSIIYFTETLIIYKKIIQKNVPYNIKFYTEFRTIFINTLPLLLISFITLFMTTYPRIIIERKTTSSILGYYSILISISNIVPSITNNLFAPLLKPYASLYKRGEFKKLFLMHLKVIIMTIVMCMLILAVSFTILPKLLKYYYGNDLYSYINIFYVGMIGVCFFSMAQVARPVLLSANKNNLMLIILCVSVIPLLILTPILVSKYSALGAAFSLLVSYLLFFILSTLSTVTIFHKHKSQ